MFSTNSRYLPPPIRTHNSSGSYHGLDRAASFLNQDWCSPTNSGPHISSPISSPSDRYRLSTRAVFPEESRCSSDDDSDSRYSPACSLSTRTSISPRTPPHIELASIDPHTIAIDYTQRRNSLPIRTPRRIRHVQSHSVGSGRSLAQDRTLPAALHPCGTSSPDSARHSVHSSTPTPPPSSPSPPPVIKREPSTIAIPYANNTTDVDAYIQKTGSSNKSMCMWRTAGHDSVCGFESSGSLVKRHIRTVHMKIRPVTCPVCGQGFSTKFHLKTHANIHTGLKPYSCPDCNKTFSNPSSKHHHRVRYHGYVQSWRHYGDKDKT